MNKSIINNIIYIGAAKKMLRRLAKKKLKKIKFSLDKKSNVGVMLIIG